MKNRLDREKQYAKNCLLKGRTGTRGYDNCFENGNGDKVVRFLMEQAQYATPERIQEAAKSLHGPCVIGGPEWKYALKVDKAAKLADAIKRSGSWDYWLYFVTHGTYEGYGKETAAA